MTLIDATPPLCLTWTPPNPFLLSLQAQRAQNIVCGFIWWLCGEVDSFDLLVSDCLHASVSVGWKKRVIQSPSRGNSTQMTLRGRKTKKRKKKKSTCLFSNTCNVRTSTVIFTVVIFRTKMKPTTSQIFVGKLASRLFSFGRSLFLFLTLTAVASR